MKGNISSIVLGVILILVTLILMPLILDANDDILTGNLTNLTGLEAIANIGPLIVLLGLFASGGLFTFQGIKGRGTGTKKDIALLVGTVIALVVALILFDIIIDETNTLWTAVGAAEGNVTALQSVVGIVPMILYVGIVVGSGGVHYAVHRRTRKHRRK